MQAIQDRIMKRKKIEKAQFFLTYVIILVANQILF